jgi:hypothetical protein
MYSSNKALITPGAINTLHQQSFNFLLNLDLNTDKILISHYPMYAENKYDDDGIQYIKFKNNIYNIIKSVDSV